MDVWPVNSPWTGPQHGGHVFLQLQQPKDGPASVGSGRFPQRPPFNVDPEFQQARCVPFVDLGHSGTQPLNNLSPGPAPGVASSPCHLSFDEMMTRCSQLMEQLTDQQLQFQQTLSATKSAMAAAPSSFIIRPAQKTQQPVEVMSSAPNDQGDSGLNQFSHPLGSTKVCHETTGSPLLPVHTVLTSSITTSQQIVSPAPPLQTRAPAASEDGLQSAGEKISDVTSDDHHPRKLVQVGNQLNPHLKQINCESNCDALERPLHHSCLCHQILVASAGSLTSAIIPNMVTSPVCEPPLIPMQLNPRSSTSESTTRRDASVCVIYAVLWIAALIRSWVNTISNGYSYVVAAASTSKPTFVLQLVLPLRRSERNR